MNDLIVGIATGYSWSVLEPFVVSLRKSGYEGRCILIVGDGPFDRPLDSTLKGSCAAAKLSKYNIETYDIGSFNEHPILIRFSVIAEIINDYRPFRLVLALDTKDIVFQSDPTIWLETRLEPHTLCVVAEGVTYETSRGNINNMQQAFGRENLDKLRKFPVLNGGVICGTPDAVSSLCLDIHELCKQDLRLAYMQVGYNEMLPDQSALNLLIRDKYKDVVLVTNENSNFCHLGNHSTPIGSQPLIHQYACFPEYLALVRRKYVD